ncbi:MAG: metal-dependent hydrolase [Gemmatimonadetes bacterium]|nr:metal-dependent hydrolase [Gemmatimonadota bacterium]
MDPVCHTLVGATIAHAMDARRAPRLVLLGVIAANVPDVDGFTYLMSDPAFAVSFRRGWTHGLPALALWVILLSAIWARLTKRPWRVFAPLAAIAVVSHPLLDLMNSYGIRLLMPLSDRWFYGDTLFIVDLSLLGVLGLGVAVAAWRVRQSHARPAFPARVGAAVAASYIALMAIMSAQTRSAAAAALGVEAPDARTLMITPQPGSPWTRGVLLRDSTHDTHAMAEWRVGGVTLVGDRWREAHGVTEPGLAAVKATRDGALFLRWSRFPYVVEGSGADSATIFVGDVRYSEGTTTSWAGIRVAASAEASAESRLAPREAR